MRGAWIVLAALLPGALIAKPRPPTTRQRAEAAWAAGAVEKACPLFAKATDQDPENPDLWLARATCEAARGDDGATRSAALRVVRLGGDTLRARAWRLLDRLGDDLLAAGPRPSHPHDVAWSACENRTPPPELACDRTWRVCVNGDDRLLGAPGFRVEACDGDCGPVPPELDDAQRRGGVGATLRVNEAVREANGESYATLSRCRLIGVDPCGLHLAVSCEGLDDEGRLPDHEIREQDLLPPDRTCRHAPCAIRWSGVTSGRSDCFVVAEEEVASGRASIHLLPADPSSDAPALTLEIESARPLRPGAADAIGRSAGWLTRDRRRLWQGDPRAGPWLQLAIEAVCTEDENESWRALVPHGRVSGRLKAAAGDGEVHFEGSF